MKTKILINRLTPTFASLLLCLVFLCGCGREGETRGGINDMVIIEVTHFRLEPQGMCEYWAETMDEHKGKRQFYDSIGKFNVGDSVCVVKKH